MKTKRKLKPCPPTVLWRGKSRQTNDDIRVVIGWHEYYGEIVLDASVEKLTGKDALGNETWKREDDVIFPAEFFHEMNRRTKKPR